MIKRQNLKTAESEFRYNEIKKIGNVSVGLKGRKSKFWLQRQLMSHLNAAAAEKHLFKTWYQMVSVSRNFRAALIICSLLRWVGLSRAVLHRVVCRKHFIISSNSSGQRSALRLELHLLRWCSSCLKLWFQLFAKNWNYFSCFQQTDRHAAFCMVICDQSNILAHIR